MAWRCLWLISTLLLSAGGRAESCSQLAPLTFVKKDIKVGGKKLKVEVADQWPQQSRGLMCRQKWAGVQGMLFVFSQQTIRHFWMKNTFLPLSIGFFDAQKKLVDMQDMQPVKSEIEAPTQYQSKAPALYALEVPVGWYKMNGIKLGDFLQY